MVSPTKTCEVKLTVVVFLRKILKMKMNDNQNKNKAVSLSSSALKC